MDGFIRLLVFAKQVGKFGEEQSGFKTRSMGQKPAHKDLGRNGLSPGHHA